MTIKIDHKLLHFNNINIIKNIYFKIILLKFYREYINTYFFSNNYLNIKISK